MNRHSTTYHRIILLLPLLLLTLLSSSCEKMFTHPFNPKGQLDSKGKILVESVLETNQDTLKIRSGIATALSTGHTVDAALLNMQLRVNDKEIELYEDKTSPKEFINQKNFYALYKLQADDVVELTADAPEVEPIQSKVAVGHDLPALEITRQVVWTDKDPWGYEGEDPTKNRCLEFTVTLDEKPEQGQYYAVQVLKRMELIGHDESVHIVNPHTYNHTELDDLYTLESSDFPMSGRHYDLCGTYHGGDIQVFDGYYVNAEGKMSLQVYVKNRTKEWISDQLYAQPRYQLIISRISKEIYNSIEKFNTVEGIWELGLGPHAYEYTNIDGGIGLLATKVDYISDWIINE